MSIRDKAIIAACVGVFTICFYLGFRLGWLIGTVLWSR